MTVVRTKSKKKGYRYKPMVKDANGRWMRSHTWDRIIDAKREERVMMEAKDKGLYCTSQYRPLPFHEAANMWLEDVERRHCSYGYHKNVSRIIEHHLNPYIGKRDLREIRPSNVTDIVSKLQKKNMNPKALNDVVKTLKAIYNYHIEEENILYNPVKKKHRVKEVRPEDKEVVWTKDEAQKFLAYADKKYSDKKRWVFLAYKIALNTGMRLGEIWALDKADFEFENNRIRISKSFDNRTTTLKPPKNGKTRFAPLSPCLATEVRLYVINAKKFGPLFTETKGSYQSQNTFRNIHWLKDTVEAGVPYTKFHNCRRFFICNYLESGGTEADLRKIVGHGSVRMTDHYMVQRDKLEDISKLVNL